MKPDDLKKYLKLKRDLLRIQAEIGLLDPNHLMGEHIRDAGFLYRGLKFLLGEVGYDERISEAMFKHYKALNAKKSRPSHKHLL